MGLFGLPNEILLEITKSLDPIDIKNFLEIRPDFTSLLIPVLGRAVQRTSRYSIIFWAAEYGYGNLIKLLIQNGVDPEVTGLDEPSALHAAAGGAAEFEMDNISVMKLLLSHVRDPERYINGDICDGDGFTILHYAVEDNRVAMVRFLVSAGVNVNQANRFNGQTALHIAVQLPCPSLAITLLALGANIESCDNNGQTPLLFALRFSEDPTQICQALIQRGANVSARENNGRTALYLLFESYQGVGCLYRMAQQLLIAGAEVNAQNEVGSTPLHAALEEQSTPNVINLLLRWGANPFIEDVFGEIPINQMFVFGYKPTVFVAE